MLEIVPFVSKVRLFVSFLLKSVGAYVNKSLSLHRCSPRGESENLRTAVLNRVGKTNC